MQMDGNWKCSDKILSKSIEAGANEEENIRFDNVNVQQRWRGSPESCEVEWPVTQMNRSFDQRCPAPSRKGKCSSRVDRINPKRRF